MQIAPDASSYHFGRIAFTELTYAEGSLARWPQLESTQSYGPDEHTEVKVGMFRIGAGQPDPSDSSRFFFPWESAGVLHNATGELVEEVVEGGLVVWLKLHDFP